ncbi:helicase-related protein [Vibrio harveyi]|nr:helicase-related protein [Vibrio harveyi]
MKFFPHHGSLAKELREDLEKRLLKEQYPTTAVCTMTLELGIDIGKVNSVIQVTSPHSISSLRQRMGRSGRRGDPSVLRVLIAEDELTKDSNVFDILRLELIQSLAMIRLLIGSKWYEPADTSLYHFSALLHQILAVIAQWGAFGLRNYLTCSVKKRVPFQKVGVDHFKVLSCPYGEY